MAIKEDDMITLPSQIFGLIFILQLSVLTPINLDNWMINTVGLLVQPDSTNMPKQPNTLKQSDTIKQPAPPKQSAPPKQADASTSDLWLEILKIIGPMIGGGTIVTLITLYHSSKQDKRQEQETRAKQHQQVIEEIAKKVNEETEKQVLKGSEKGTYTLSTYLITSIINSSRNFKTENMKEKELVPGRGYLLTALMEWGLNDQTFYEPIQKTSFEGADAENACFNGANLRGAKLRGAKLNRASLIGAKLNEMTITVGRSDVLGRNRFKRGEFKRGKFKRGRFDRVKFE